VSPAVQTQNAGVCFLFDRQNRVITPVLARLRRQGATAWGLRGLDVRIEPGEGVALIGRTGSGKTTFLRLLAQVLVPDEGRVDVTGRIGSLLSVQAGLLTPLTGRENSMLLGVLAGLSRADVKERVPQIKERSGLGDAFERSVSSYSQGMRARLGFAVADSTDPEILLLDEVHEAVDQHYRDVLESRAKSIRDRGGIVVAAGHDHDVLERLCPRALLLSEGRVVADGPFARVRLEYLAAAETAAASEL
jgi:ABC-type polysaccharide/polyol phosphate transport system ATPase subunit